MNNLELTTGKSYNSAFKYNPDYREKPVPEQYLQYYKGKNTTDKYLFVGFNGSPTMPPSNMMKALIDSMHALMMWKEDTQNSGIYVDPTAYLNTAIDMSPWIKSYWNRLNREYVGVQLWQLVSWGLGCSILVMILIVILKL